MMPRKFWSGLLLAIGIYLALTGALSFNVAIFGVHPIRLWTSADRYYQIVPQESSHALAIGAGCIVVALLLGAASIRVWRTKR